MKSKYYQLYFTVETDESLKGYIQVPVKKAS